MKKKFKELKIKTLVIILLIHNMEIKITQLNKINLKFIKKKIKNFLKEKVQTKNYLIFIKMTNTHLKGTVLNSSKRKIPDHDLNHMTNSQIGKRQTKSLSHNDAKSFEYEQV